MRGRVIPETANRRDWPRLVAEGHKDHANRLNALESPETITLTPSSTPASPVEGMIYYDSTANKLKCYDGTNWNDLW